MAQTADHPTASAGSPRHTEAPASPSATPELGYRREITVPPSPPLLLTEVPKNQTVVCVCNESVRTVVVPPTDTLAAPSSERCPRGPRSGPSHRTEENRHTSGSSAGPQLQNTPSRPMEASRLPSPSARAASQLHPDNSPSATSPNHYSPSPPASNCPSPGSPHQNIDWRNYTTYKEYIDNKRLYMYGCRTIQERLDSLRAATVSHVNSVSQQQTPPPVTTASSTPLGLHSAGLSGSQVRRRSTSHDRAYVSPGVVTPLRSVSQERLLGPPGERGLYRDWPRSASQDALPSSTLSGGAVKPRARSCDYLGRQGGGEGLATRLVDVDEQSHLIFQGNEARASRLCGSGRGGSQPLRNMGASVGFTDPSPAPRAESLGSSLASPHPASLAGGRASRLTVKAASLDASASAASYIASALASVQSHISGSSASQDPIKEQRPVAVGNHLPHSSVPSHLQHRGRADSLKEPGSQEVSRGVRSASCSAPSKSPALRTLQQGGATNSTPSAVTSNGTAPRLRAQVGRTESQEPANEKEGLEGAEAKVVVVMRREKSGPHPIRHPSYILAVNDAEAGGPGSPGSPGAGAEGGGVCWLPNDARREVHIRRFGEQHNASVSSLGDSLDSIPFIGELWAPVHLYT